MNHRTSTLIAALAAGIIAAATAQAAQDHEWRHTASYGAAALLLALLAHHAHQSASQARTAAVRARRAERLRRPPVDRACCELAFLTEGARRVHEPTCPALPAAR
ncbi:hypothetical protein [Streptomyces abikoensis]|uniref:Uncharacterized protein n=1 Tax=Streptomyces abikoensis TaxID=97398 RepID=A0ABW7T9H6_9ACTN